MAVPTLTSNSPTTHGIFMPPKTPLVLTASRWSLFKLGAANANPLPPGMSLEEGPGLTAAVVGTPTALGTYGTVKVECEAMDNGEKSAELTIEIKVVAAQFQAGTNALFAAPAVVEIAVPDKTSTLVKDTGIKHAGATRSTSVQTEIEVLLAACVGNVEFERVN